VIMMTTSIITRARRINVDRLLVIITTAAAAVEYGTVTTVTSEWVGSWMIAVVYCVV